MYNNAFKQVTLNFNLRDTKAKRYTSVIYIIAYNGTQYRYSTNRQVKPLQWDKKQQKAVISPMLTNEENDNNFSLNQEIKRLKLAFDEFNYYFCTHKEECIKDVITRYFKSNTNQESTNNMPKQFTKNGLFTRAFNKLVDDKKLAKNTLKKKRSNFKVIMEYVNKDSVRITNNKFLISDFQDWAKKDSKKGNEYINKLSNFFNDLIQVIRTDQRTRNYDVLEQTYKHLDVEKADLLEKVHFELTDEEVNTIKTTELEDEKLNNVRLAFSIMLCTGLRHSDLIQTIEKVNNTTDKNILIKCKKTKITAQVERTEELAELCRKCANFGSLKYIQNCNFNTLLREVAKQLNLNRVRTYTNSKGETVTEEIYKHLTSHSARVSKATKSVRNGISKDLIMLEQGWNEEKTLNGIYAQITEEDKANKAIKLREEERQKRQQATTTTSTEDIRVIIDQALAANNELTDVINEYKRVLLMLGVDGAIWYDINNIDELTRLVHYNETKLSQNYGIDFKTIKDIFNDGTTIAEQRKKLEEVIKATETHL